MVVWVLAPVDQVLVDEGGTAARVNEDEDFMRAHPTMETDHAPPSWWSARGHCRIDAHELVLKAHIARHGAAVVMLGWQHIEEELSPDTCGCGSTCRRK
jgi:hypothetical protein